MKIIYLALAVAFAVADDQIHFVWELTRHGARACKNATGFEPNIGADDLTAQGMRQHVLNGRYNRERYVTQYKLLSAYNVPSEIQIVSTTVDRTFQSIYSEMLGLYPPGQGSSSLTQLT